MSLQSPKEKLPRAGGGRNPAITMDRLVLPLVTFLLITIAYVSGGLGLGYIGTMAVLGVLSGVMLVPNLALVVGVATLGLGIPLMLIAMNGLLYGLTLAPLLMAPSPAMLLMSYALLGVLVFGAQLPIWRQKARLQAWAEDRKDRPVIRAQGAPIDQLTVVAAPVETYSGAQGGVPLWDGEGQLRRYLLETGQVRAIRVITPTELGKAPGSVFVWKDGYERFADPTMGEGDYTLWLWHRQPAKPSLPAMPLFKMGKCREVTIREGGAAQAGPILAQTVMVTAAPRVSLPPMISPVLSGMTSGGNSGGVLWLSGLPIELNGFDGRDIWSMLGIDLSGFEVGDHPNSRARQGRLDREAQQAQSWDREWHLAMSLLERDPLGQKSTMETRALQSFFHNRKQRAALLDRDEEFVLGLLNAVFAAPQAPNAGPLFGQLLFAAEQSARVAAAISTQIDRAEAGLPHQIPAKLLDRAKTYRAKFKKTA